MAYTYEERKEYELNRRTTIESQEAFFRGALLRMAIDDTVEEIEKDAEFACDILFTCGFCSIKRYRCDRCPLDAKHEKALMEVRMGLRGGDLKEEVYKKLK